MLPVKSRLILLAIAFAILAIAGIAVDDVRSITPQTSAGVATTLSAQPAPDQDLPVIARAAATAPASAQTMLDFTPHLHIHQAPGVSTRTHNTPVERNHNAATPQTIPLLI